MTPLAGIFFPTGTRIWTKAARTDDLSGSENVREILPWLKLSADLDPDNVQTYTVTAFWLRVRMHKVAEADAFLHEGLRNNPDSYDILFELGRLYYENYHDTDRARNVWEQAVRKWLSARRRRRKRKTSSSSNKSPPISANSKATPAIMPRPSTGFRPRKKSRSRPAHLQKQIDELKKKMAAQPSPATASRIEQRPLQSGAAICSISIAISRRRGLCRTEIAYRKFDQVSSLLLQLRLRLVFPRRLV